MERQWNIDLKVPSETKAFFLPQNTKPYFSRLYYICVKLLLNEKMPFLRIALYIPMELVTTKPKLERVFFIQSNQRPF